MMIPTSQPGARRAVHRVVLALTLLTTLFPSHSVAGTTESGAAPATGHPRLRIPDGLFEATRSDEVGGRPRDVRFASADRWPSTVSQTARETTRRSGWRKLAGGLVGAAGGFFAGAF